MGMAGSPFAYFVVLKPHYTTERPQGPGKLQKKCPIWATDSLDIIILQVARQETITRAQFAQFATCRLPKFGGSFKRRRDHQPCGESRAGGNWEGLNICAFNVRRARCREALKCRGGAASTVCRGRPAWPRWFQ